jgi:hypothetical protein
MKLKAVLIALLVAVVVPCQAFAKPRSSVAITIKATVQPFAEWADTNPISFELDAAGVPQGADRACILSKSVTLYTNTETRIVPVAVSNDGVLSNGAKTLPTTYRLTGPVANPDSAFKAPAQFFSPGNVYQLSPTSRVGAYSITVSVQTTKPVEARGDADMRQYACSIQLTAVWQDGE